MALNHSLSMQIFKQNSPHSLFKSSQFSFTIHEVCKGTYSVPLCVCVYVHTHIEPRGGKVKARVHAFGWEIEKQSTYIQYIGKQREKQTLYVMPPFEFAIFSFPPSTVLKVAALKGNNHYLLSKGIDPGSARLCSAVQCVGQYYCSSVYYYRGATTIVLLLLCLSSSLSPP